MSETLDYRLPQQKHRWNSGTSVSDLAVAKGVDKPWTCELCEFYTANLRHIQNGYCFHDWSKRLGDLECCARCGILMNSRNVRRSCIGSVSLSLREGKVMSDYLNDPLALAVLFHVTYEKLAPQKGYETRTETRVFDPESANGKLMIATCAEIQKAIREG